MLIIGILDVYVIDGLRKFEAKVKATQDVYIINGRAYMYQVK